MSRTPVEGISVSKCSLPVLAPAAFQPVPSPVAVSAQPTPVPLVSKIYLLPQLVMDPVKPGLLLLLKSAGKI